MPNGVVADNAKGKFDVTKLVAMAKPGAASNAWISPRTFPSPSGWTGTRRFGTETRLQPRRAWHYKVVAIDYGLQRNILVA